MCCNTVLVISEHTAPLPHPGQAGFIPRRVRLIVFLADLEDDSIVVQMVSVTDAAEWEPLTKVVRDEIAAAAEPWQAAPQSQRRRHKPSDSPPVPARRADRDLQAAPDGSAPAATISNNAATSSSAPAQQDSESAPGRADEWPCACGATTVKLHPRQGGADDEPNAQHPAEAGSGGGGTGSPVCDASPADVVASPRSVDGY